MLLAASMRIPMPAHAAQPICKIPHSAVAL
jgi:hypothetical protein